MTVVIDDQLLLTVLSGTASAWLVDELGSSAVYTTSAWYYRLARAVLSPAGVGALSSQAAQLPKEARDQLVGSLRRLPDLVGLPSARITVPVMAELRVRRALNMLNAEALAVAILIEGRLVVTTESPLLRDGATDMGIHCDVVA